MNTSARRATLKATVVNNGVGPAPATQTEFLLDGSSVLAMVNTPALGPGESAVVTTIWNFTGVKNTHVLQATADETNTAAESIESNNARSLTVTVQGNSLK